jgi:ABC-2 type transport system ATP-binding protein
VGTLRAPIEARNLTKRYDDLDAIHGLCLSADEGQVLGLLGPNGAGKSTTIKVLVGLVHPTEGEAWIGGHHVQDEGIQARRQLGYLPEVVGLYEQLTAEAYLRYIARFHGTSGPRATHRIEALLADVRLTQAADRPIGTFSKGMRQRLALAGALFHDPPVLVLDEPLTGLDPEGIVKMKQAIEQLGRQRTVLVSSHELHAVESLCDRAIILRDGEELTSAPVAELTRRDPPRYTLTTADPLPEPRALTDVDGVRSIHASSQNTLQVEVTDADAASLLVDHLVREGHRVRHLERDERTLEEAFVDITGVRA